MESRAHATQHVERAQKKHKIAGIKQLQATLIGNFLEVKSRIPPNVFGEIVVITPKLFESRRGYKEQTSRLHRLAYLLYGTNVVRDMFYDVQQK